MEFKDPLLVRDRHGEETHSLRDMLAGRNAFLVCGGPSSNNLDLSLLKQRGIFTMAVNNMAGKFWSNAFICADPPLKFHHGIWLDPTIMKFVPTTKVRGNRVKLREKVGKDFIVLERDGKPVTVPTCPNLWAFGRRSWMALDDTFFTEPEAAWGNHNEGVTRTGLEKTVNTFLLGLRVLYHLGARRIYLVGCDWRMNPEAGVCSNYSFGETRDADAVKSNNDQYRIAGIWLERMQQSGLFKKFGLEIYNCFERSGLRAFEHVPFELAVEDTLKGFPQEPFDLADWYAKR